MKRFLCLLIVMLMLLCSCSAEDSSIMPYKDVRFEGDFHCRIYYEEVEGVIEGKRAKEIYKILSDALLEYEKEEDARDYSPLGSHDKELFISFYKIDAEDFTEDNRLSYMYVCHFQDNGRIQIFDSAYKSFALSLTLNPSIFDAVVNKILELFSLDFSEIYCYNGSAKPTEYIKQGLFLSLWDSCTLFAAQSI